MIDWFTVAAQIVNFLILVALLKYFLYGRILAAMEARQSGITARWDDAQQQRDEAARELAEAQEKNRRLDEERERMMAVVSQEVESERQALLAGVREQADRVQQRWAESIGEQSDAFLRDLRRRTAEEVCGIARRTLSDLANVELQRQIVNCFLSRLNELDDASRQQVSAGANGERGTAVVRTSHPLPDDLRAAVADALHQSVQAELEIRFETTSDLICGIALQTGTHTLAWNVRDYLSGLEQQLQQALEEESLTAAITTRE